MVSLPLGQVIYEPGIALQHIYFPTDSIISLLYVMLDGASAEIAVVGNADGFAQVFPEHKFHIDRAHIQTMMYLKLSLAGHLTIFLTRTRGPFWTIRPAGILWGAVLGRQIVATLFAVYGVLMTPLGWGWAGFVWAYLLLWFVINDRVKLLAYRVSDPVKKGKASPDAKPEVDAKPAGESKR
jgi:H+-transporting ATPase